MDMARRERAQWLLMSFNLQSRHDHCCPHPKYEGAFYPVACNEYRVASRGLESRGFAIRWGVCRAPRMLLKSTVLPARDLRRATVSFDEIIPISWVWV